MNDAHDEFFVGYLPASKSTTKFSILFGVAVLVFALGVALVLAAFQRSPGTNLDREAYSTTLKGSYVASPYPLLYTEDGNGVLLVNPGKSGVPGPERVGAASVEARGLLLQRDGRRLLESYEFKPLSEPVEAAPESRTLGELKVAGIVMDAKCFYGRMRPGDGKPHRACAQYCIDSGIPPVLVSEPDSAQARHYVLTDRSGRPINQAILPYVAEPISIEGEASQRGDVFFLAIDIDSIVRL
ncbi:MAG: hypothetical protein AAFP04_04605 [Myxococcota bacterium]